jgi:hypothetical protein
VIVERGGVCADPGGYEKIIVRDETDRIVCEVDIDHGGSGK